MYVFNTALAAGTVGISTHIVRLHFSARRTIQTRLAVSLELIDQIMCGGDKRIVHLYALGRNLCRLAVLED
jgi:hypothetical protein